MSVFRLTPALISSLPAYLVAFVNALYIIGQANSSVSRQTFSE